MPKAKAKPATSQAALEAIDGYQVMVKGKEVYVKDLTEEQAKVELCGAIDFMERMDSLAFDLQATMKAWRKGEKIPE